MNIIVETLKIMLKNFIAPWNTIEQWVKVGHKTVKNAEINPKSLKIIEN